MGQRLRYQQVAFPARVEHRVTLERAGGELDQHVVVAGSALEWTAQADQGRGIGRRMQRHRGGPGLAGQHAFGDHSPR